MHTIYCNRSSIICSSEKDNHLSCYILIYIFTLCPVWLWGAQGEGRKSSGSKKNRNFRGSSWSFFPSDCTGWLLLGSTESLQPSPGYYIHLSLSILPPLPVSANVSTSFSLCNPQLLGHFQVVPQAISIPKACTVGNNKWEKSKGGNLGQWKHILPLFLYITLRETKNLKMWINDQELVGRRSAIGMTRGTS